MIRLLVAVLAATVAVVWGVRAVDAGRLLQERDAAAVASRSSSSYRVDWRARYRREHRHVQRLLRQLRNVRHVQAVEPVPEVGWPWVAIADCESGDGDGRPPYTADWAYNGPSGFDGGIQFEPGTWSAYRGPGDPAFAYEASPAAQVAVGERVLAVQGWGAWPVCSRKVGLR